MKLNPMNVFTGALLVLTSLAGCGRPTESNQTTKAGLENNKTTKEDLIKEVQNLLDQATAEELYTFKPSAKEMNEQALRAFLKQDIAERIKYRELKTVKELKADKEMVQKGINKTPKDEQEKMRNMLQFQNKMVEIIDKIIEEKTK